MEEISSSSNIDKFIEGLPKSHFLFENVEIRQWEGFWLRPAVAAAAAAFRTSFAARDDDVFLASSMKTGTTWLKALCFCITQRHHHDRTLSLSEQRRLNLQTLAKENPHSLVPTVEVAAYVRSDAAPAPAPAAAAPHARLLHTHLPHALLPVSVRESSCKIVYVARNPGDTLISHWHFQNSLLRREGSPLPLEEFVDGFCSGLQPFGPFVEHVAGYWEESRKRPEKVLFIKYEELKSDPKSQVLKIAEFLGRPFGDGDEDEGEVEEIVRSCSLERLKNLEVNKSGSHFVNSPNSGLFRKGEVGDSKHYLTPEMEAKIDRTIRLKLEALGLYF